MPAVRTIIKPPLSDTMTIRVPDEYRSYSMEVFFVPIAMHEETQRPVWAGLCEDAIKKNMDGPHDMDSLRESIKSAERLQTV